MFEKQVAHGYFIMSAAAGLFVDGYEKDPCLLNYGIDEFVLPNRFIREQPLCTGLPAKKKFRRI